MTDSQAVKKFTGTWLVGKGVRGEERGGDRMTGMEAEVKGRLWKRRNYTINENKCREIRERKK